MDRLTVRVVLFGLLGVVVFNAVVITLNSENTALIGSLVNVDLAAIGVIGAIAGFINRASKNGDSDDNNK